MAADVPHDEPTGFLFVRVDTPWAKTRHDNWSKMKVPGQQSTFGNPHGLSSIYGFAMFSARAVCLDRQMDTSKISRCDRVPPCSLFAMITPSLTVLDRRLLRM